MQVCPDMYQKNIQDSQTQRIQVDCPQWVKCLPKWLKAFVNKNKKSNCISCNSTTVPKGILMHATAGQISKVTLWSSMDLVGTSSWPVVKTLWPNKYLCPN